MVWSIYVLLIVDFIQFYKSNKTNHFICKSWTYESPLANRWHQLNIVNHEINYNSWGSKLYFEVWASNVLDPSLNEDNFDLKKNYNTYGRNTIEVIVKQLLYYDYVNIKHYPLSDIAKSSLILWRNLAFANLYTCNAHCIPIMHNSSLPGSSSKIRIGIYIYNRICRMR